MADHDDLKLELRRLARERDAVILAHNYQRPEVQDAADHTGDSLELARKAAATDAKVILFCGVRFMAETASILSPEKTVLMPEPRAGCPMANMATAEGLRRLKAEHPEAVVVSYVNTSAEVKAETDVCCTSANAVQVVQRFAADQEIIFVPDRNLGDYVNRMTGRRMILWPGYCHVHDAITTAQIEAARTAHPEAVVLAHPECRREVLEMADLVTSTSGMLREPAKNAALHVHHRHRDRPAAPARTPLPRSALRGGLGARRLPGHEAHDARALRRDPRSTSSTTPSGTRCASRPTSARRRCAPSSG